MASSTNKNAKFLISGVSLSRLSKLLIKEYGPSGLLSFSTERAVSKAEPTENDMERIKWYFSKMDVRFLDKKS